MPYYPDHPENPYHPRRRRSLLSQDSWNSIGMVLLCLFFVLTLLAAVGYVMTRPSVSAFLNSQDLTLTFRGRDPSYQGQPPSDYSDGIVYED